MLTCASVTDGFAQKLNSITSSHIFQILWLNNLTLHIGTLWILSLLYHWNGKVIDWISLDGTVGFK